MKKVINFFVAGCGATLLLLTSCSKTTDKSNVMVIHASPDAPNVDVLVDNVKVSALTNVAYGTASTYNILDAGKRNIKVNATGQTTSVITTDQTLEKDASYSIFATGKLSAIAPVVTKDDLTAPASGKAHIRFAHLSPDAPAVDIFVKGTTTKLFSNAAFKSVSSFLPVAAASYELEVKLTGTNTTVLVIPAIKLESGKIYTAYAKGLATPGAPTAQALGYGLITNK